MAAAVATPQQEAVASPKKGVWRMVRENPYIFGLSMVGPDLYPWVVRL
jgi:hypothetical protein